MPKGDTSTKTVGENRRRGPNDRDRPARIAEAAIAVIAERGVEGLTHRSVALRAGVPLGSTTYHFATLDDLLGAALRTAAERNTANLRAWDAALPQGADLAAALADLTTTWLTEKRSQTMVEYELYVAALHRPGLRATSAGWDAALAEIFTARTNPTTGRLLAVAVCGALMQGLLTDPPPTHAELEVMFCAALSPAKTSPDAPHRVREG